MISKMLFIGERGFRRVKANTKLLFIVLTLFVFPILFVLVLEQFYSVATANIQTIEQERTTSIHDSVAILLPEHGSDVLSTALATLQATNKDITVFRVYQEITPELLTVIASTNREELGATSTPTTLLKLGRIGENETYQVPLQGITGRVEQAVRYIELPDKQLYIFSEHTRSQVDSMFTKRKQDAYMLLTLIFAFLIGLAYWINRQSDWERQYKQLQGTLEERDLFSNMIAHEFRTPLTAIKGYASFLQESDTITTEEKRYADTISESAERLILLVNDFLEIARIQSGKMQITTTSIDVRSVIESVVLSLETSAQQKSLQLVFTPALQPQMLETDQNRFVQVLTNIISNAVKYTAAGTVEIQCEQDRTGITIKVKDTGMGISAADQKKLFAPFSRVGGVEHTTTTGTGLGMWITKQMITVLGGTISVESIKGVGTHIVLHFKSTNH